MKEKTIVMRYELNPKGQICTSAQTPEMELFALEVSYVLGNCLDV